MTPTISIIIPTLNEEAILRRNLSQLRQETKCEIILTDGGSSDETLSIAKEFGCRIVCGDSGRGKQMNRGTDIARGDIVLFLHADTFLPADFPSLIEKTLKDKSISLGCFSLQTDKNSYRMAIICFFANLRSRFLSMPYGDQAFFTTKEQFVEMGGFPEVEIMEDYIFARKMKKVGKIITLQEPVITSARRWQNIGPAKTTLLNQVILLAHLLGVRPKVLAKIYQRLRGIGAHN